MHVKSDNLESFFDSKRKELAVQKKNQSEVEKNQFKKKEEIMKTKGQTKKEMKKGWKKNSMKENHKKDQK